MATGIFIGSGEGGANPQQLELSRANRHGLIAGATGTGKTVTLQGLIEGFSAALLRGLFGTLIGKRSRYGLVSQEKPLRVNLSKSGLGGSVGVTGLRVGSGPKGKYLHAGRGGLYFRKSLGKQALHGTALEREATEPAKPKDGLARFLKGLFLGR